VGFSSRGCSDLCGELMIELALMAALAGPQQTTPPATYTPPQPIYTPPPSPGSPTQPIVPASSPKPLQTPSPAPSGGNWRDKMWQRYKQQSGTN
jgi:hypothetical protein